MQQTAPPGRLAGGAEELCFDSNFIDILEPLNFHVLYHVPNTVVDGEMDACDALLSYFNTRRVSYNHLPSWRAWCLSVGHQMEGVISEDCWFGASSQKWTFRNDWFLLGLLLSSNRWYWFTEQKQVLSFYVTMPLNGWVDLCSSWPSLTSRWNPN